MIKRATAFLASAVLSACATHSLSGSLATPEATLRAYMVAIIAGDQAAAQRVVETPQPFSLNGPVPVSEYRIKKKITFGPAETTAWNSKEIVPPAKVGDVELQVEETINGKNQMFSYNLREFDGEWKIITLSVWGME